ncbi:hypothetical protein K435DRAFT_700062, partial [Dendrothele bispora CBS 962.96]
VLYLLIAETTNTILNIGIIYEALLLKFGASIFLWMINTYLMNDIKGDLSALISTPVQIFMTWRICVITQSWIPLFLVTPFALASLTGSIWLAISVTNSPQFRTFDSFRGAAVTWLVPSAVADIFITVCLVWVLSKQKTGVPQLNDHLDRINRFAIQTGAITALFALADAIVFVSLPVSTFAEFHGQAIECFLLAHHRVRMNSKKPAFKLLI